MAAQNGKDMEAHFPARQDARALLTPGCCPQVEHIAVCLQCGALVNAEVADQHVCSLGMSHMLVRAAAVLLKRSA